MHKTNSANCDNNALYDNSVEKHYFSIPKVKDTFCYKIYKVYNFQSSVVLAFHSLSNVSIDKVIDYPLSSDEMIYSVKL